jgi:hypothetical protein
MKIIQIMPIDKSISDKLKSTISDTSTVIGIALIENDEGCQELRYIHTSLYGEPEPYVDVED